MSQQGADAAAAGAAAATTSAENSQISAAAAIRSADAATASSEAAQRSADAANRNADAAQRSLFATERSSSAAESSVELNRKKAMVDLIPPLGSGDPRQVDATLIMLASMAEPDLAERMAELYRAEGGIGALRLLSTSAGDAAVVAQAKSTLKQMLDSIGTSVVRISVVESAEVGTGALGTGFYVKHNIVAAPSYLFTEATYSITVRMHDGVVSAARILAYGSEEHSIAVLEVSEQRKALQLVEETSQ